MLSNNFNSEHKINRNSNIFDSEVSSNLKSTNQTDNLKVVIRIRPALPREVEQDLPFRSIVLVSNDNKSCNLVEYLGAELSEYERQREWVENPNLFQLHRFTFDHVFDMNSSQSEVYETTAKPAVMSILEGYNSTIFAYGQTGTGKTFTMEGFTYNSSDLLRGIIPRSIEEIFNYIELFSNSDTKFMVRASYLQIYNEAISDLLKPEKTSLQVREDKKKGVFVEGLSEWAVRNPADIYTLLQRGASCRATAATKMNDVSSRSHAVFMIVVEQLTIVEGNNKEALTQIKVGKLNLVDLAGSERIRVTGATGKQLEESKKINKSLSALGNVIYALTDNKGRSHIPYRDSKLTRLLEDSLGGNCKTTMMAMISPCHDSFSESLSTLHFARRAKNIKNRPTINEDVDHRALIRQYEVELKKLRNELEEKSRLIHSNEIVMQLEEERKRAEEDKKKAIYALEQASMQYLQEREEKKKLEIKIQMMNSQVLIGGHKLEETPQFISALEERHTKLSKEFDMKLQEFEKERQQIKEDKAQVEHYKKFLLQLRDIMIALTTRLNERNETIDQLQEEIDAYDKINKDLEDVIELRNFTIEKLQEVLKANKINVPTEIIENNNKLKYNPRRQNNVDKLYIPYEVEKNPKEYENAPISMLNPDEKIRELNLIVSDFEKESNIMKIVLQKFLNSNIDGRITVNDLMKKFGNDETQIKLREMEEFKYNMMKQLESKDLLISNQRLDNENLMEQINRLEKRLDYIDDEKTEVSNMKEEIIRNLEKMLKKIDLDQNIKTVKFDIITTLKILLQKNENINSTQNYMNNSNMSKHHSNSNPNLIHMQNIPNTNSLKPHSFLEDKNTLNFNDRSNIANYDNNNNNNYNTGSNYYSPGAIYNKSNNNESANNSNLNIKSNAAPNKISNENTNTGSNRSASINAFNRPAINSNTNLNTNNNVPPNIISNQSSILNNLLNINNKKTTIQSSTPTPSKTKPNDSYFNNQDRSSNQNVKVMNQVNNSSNLRMNLNNLINNSNYNINNKNLPHPVSTGNLVGNADRNNGNFNLGSKSSNNLNPKSGNDQNFNMNQVGFVSKFINSHK